MALMSLLFVVAPTMSCAIAHEIRPAYLQIEETAPNQFDVLWKQPSLGRVALRLEPKVSNGLLDTSPDEQYLAGGYIIKRWKARRLALSSFEKTTVRIQGLEGTFTDALVNVRLSNGRHIYALLKADNPMLTIRGSAAERLAVSAYLLLGIQHILKGADHLSFVLGLILLVRARPLLVSTITAFTVAHSITLAVATLGYVRVSVPAIESVVALSIMFIAIELTRFWRGQESATTRHPWLIAFTIGLLHGFAFAGSLADIGLPTHNIAAALLLFNCGVELGQLLFVGVILASAALLRASRWGTLGSYGRWSIAYCIGASASYWAIERIGALLPSFN